MSDDRPLTAFSGGSDTDDVADDDNDTADEAAAKADDDDNAADAANATADDDVDTEPADITYRWQPAGAVCAQCEATTETQWRSDGQFVCPDCKVW